MISSQLLETVVYQEILEVFARGKLFILRRNSTIMDLGNILTNLISGNFEGIALVDLSFLIIGLALILIIISAIILFLVNKKSNEEKTAAKILKNISLMRKGKLKLKKDSKENVVPVKEKKVVITKKEKTSEKMEIKPTEISLKQLLIKKFKPKIEKQLRTKIKVIDFNAKKNNFVTKINVQGHDLELELDSSGKIIDYKNLN
jgi:hypothetical protein